MAFTKAQKRNLDELQAAVDRLEAAEASLKVEISAAQDRLYSARREAKRAEKPTPAMIEVLDRIAGDKGRVKSSRWMTVSYFWTDGDRTGYIRNSIFFGLLSRCAIESVQSEKEALVESYRITDHGRKILVNRVPGV